MKQDRLRVLAREASIYERPEPLVTFGTMLDGFFDEVRKEFFKLWKS
jgi:hypothetical protein